jgi:hypothetical protein
MKTWKLMLIYGFLVWLIPFAVSFGIFPLKLARSPLFETIMSIVLIGRFRCSQSYILGA